MELIRVNTPVLYIPVLSPSCLPWGRSEELHTLCLSFVFPAFESLVFLPVCASTPVFFLSHPHLLVPFYTLLNQMSTLKCQLFSPLQLVNETGSRGGRRKHGRLHFTLHSHLPFKMHICLDPSCYFYHSLSSCLSFWSPLSPFLSFFCLSLSFSLLVQPSAVLMKGWLM